MSGFDHGPKSDRQMCIGNVSVAEFSFLEYLVFFAVTEIMWKTLCDAISSAVIREEVNFISF